MSCENCNCSNQANYENIFMPKEAKIIKTKMSTASEKRFWVKWADGSQAKFQPGQFLEVSLFGYGEIPIGYASSPTFKDNFEIVIRAVGRVSNALHKLEKGDSIFLRGPLGNGFPMDSLKNNDVLVVAGGIGYCPTRSLVNYILDKRDEFGEFTLFYGARSPKDRMFNDDFDRFKNMDRVNVLETVDKGDETWKGNVGVITTLFNKTDKINKDTRVIICGPPIMYKFVIAETDKLGIPHSNIYVDLERRMKCGIGKCGHCQINDKYVCIDGPVFKYSELEDREEAF